MKYKHHILFWIAQSVLLFALLIAMIDVLTPEAGNETASIVTMLLGLFLSGIFYAWGYKIQRLEKRKRHEEGAIDTKHKNDRVDLILQDLSADDLQEIKQRIEDNELKNEAVYERIVEELILKEK